MMVLALFLVVVVLLLQPFRMLLARQKKGHVTSRRLANVRRLVNLRPLLPYPHPITMLPCSRDLPCEQSRSGTYKHDETHSSGECSREERATNKH